MIPHYRLPRMIERVSQTLSLPVFADDGTTAQTATSGTVSIYAGSRAIVEGAAISVGPQLPTHWQLLKQAMRACQSVGWKKWTLTIGGTVFTFQRPAYLVRRVLYPTLIDADLVEYHSDLLSLLDPDDSNLQRYRDNAWHAIQTALIRQGRRPQLVLDAWQLRSLHAYRTLELFYRDAASSVGDGRYIELARSMASWQQRDGLRFHSDTMQMRMDTSAMRSIETSAGSGVVYLTAPKATF